MENQIPPDMKVDCDYAEILRWACERGRVLGGHAVYAPADRTLLDRRKDVAQSVLKRAGGDYRQAAAQLGISHTTLYEWFPKAKNIIRLAACVALVALVGCATPVFSEPPTITPQPVPLSIIPPLPTALSSRSVTAPVPTNGSVWLQWTPGAAPQTLVNLTNQTAVDVGDSSLARVAALQVGVKQGFIVTNATGASNMAVGPATVETNRITEIGQIYAAPLFTGRSNYLVTSTNLITWSVEKLLGTNGTAVFLVTNSEPARFYRVKAF